MPTRGATGTTNSRITVYASFWSARSPKLTGILARLRKVFLQRVPIVFVPADAEMILSACRKASMIENNFGVHALLGQLEFHNRVDTRCPADFAPRLDDSFVRREVDLPPDDVTAEERESASSRSADVGWFLPVGHAGFTELDDSIELLRVGQRVINAFSTRF